VQVQGLTVQKVLQYFYYSGIVLISQRAFKAAMESLLVVRVVVRFTLLSPSQGHHGAGGGRKCHQR
jgi:hypothetical protein